MAVQVKMAGSDRTITIKTSKAPKGASPSKRPGANNGPARQRYWASGRLRQNKVKNLMKHNGFTRAEAEAFWETARQGRRTRWAR
jgi:hypothetical protein